LVITLFGPQIKKHLITGPLPVEVSIAGEEEIRRRGEVAFLDNTIDQATGTILLRATFGNQERALWPGQFVNVTLTLSLQPDALVVPTPAVQTGQQGQYVFVVTPAAVAEYRPVTVARVVGNEAVVDEGLSPGEKVVTSGQLRLTQGAQVTIVATGQAESRERSQ